MPEKEHPVSLTALLHGPDQPGLVAKVSGWIFDTGGNIIHADLHHDFEGGVFFQRVEWTNPKADLNEQAAAFSQFAKWLGMEVRTVLSTHRPKMALMVSKIEHCFHDILVRWRMDELPCDIVGVVSNHRDLEEATLHYGLPFHHIEVTGENKPEAEARQVEILRDLGVEMVGMARYMQVLSADFLREVGCPVINIHHSFLPAFAGARPYHQAHARGVKLIGATAHYATPELDDGPIIHQAVDRVSHRHSVADLVRKGRDLEKVVFSTAIRLHLQNRILVYNNKTVVFD